MRLIDADALLENVFVFTECDIKGAYIEEEDLKNAPTIDAVPVVRCKDCRRRYDHDECPMCCLTSDDFFEYTRDDGFCDRGERKDGEG